MWPGDRDLEGCHILPSLEPLWNHKMHIKQRDKHQSCRPRRDEDKKVNK